MPGGSGRDSSPFGPRTRTISSATSIWTPDGTAIGIRPIRDIATSLPHLAEDLAADAQPTRRLTGHDAARCRQDRRAHAAVHPRDVRALGVHAQPRTADALQPQEHRLLATSVAQLDAEVALALVLLHVEGPDVALFAQHPRDFHLQLRGRHHHA